MKALRTSAALLPVVIAGCSGFNAADFKGAAPALVLEDYFLGDTVASGIFEDRFGRVRNQFSVAIAGTIVDGALVLDERFAYSDGKQDRRVWRIRRTGPNAYEGRDRKSTRLNSSH